MACLEDIPFLFLCVERKDEEENRLRTDQLPFQNTIPLLKRMHDQPAREKVTFAACVPKVHCTDMWYPIQDQGNILIQNQCERAW